MFPIILSDVLDVKMFEEHQKLTRKYDYQTVNMGLGDKLFGVYTPPDLLAALLRKASDAIGRELSCNVSFVRLNHKHTDVSPRIHADDAAMRDVAAAGVFYFESSEHGTGLFKHPVWGTHHRQGTPHVFKDLTDWEMYFHYKAVANSMLMYEASMFHSRWPVISYGESKDDGRVIVVLFMSYKK